MQVSPDFIIGTIVGLLTAFLWAISTIIYKTQSGEATPLAIAALKMWGAMFFMTVIVVLPFRTTPFYMPFDALIILVVSVTVSLIIGDFAYLTAQERIGVSYAFPIASTYPIATYIIAIFLVGETVLLSKAAGIIVAVLGVILISREQAIRNESEENSKYDKLGLGLAFFTTLCWSLGSVLLQIGVADVDPIDATWIRVIFGGLIMVPIFATALNRGMPSPTKQASKVIFAASLLGMTIGSIFYTYTVKLIGASVAALLGSTSPLFAVPISIYYLHEVFNRKSLIGVLLTVTGVALVVFAA
jgi:drug/metabolite transporter (DMT)-like permease